MFLYLILKKFLQQKICENDLSNINYQDLNLMDTFPELTKAIPIQSSILEQIAPDGDTQYDQLIIKGHVLTENGYIYKEQYKYTQNEHNELARNNNLSPIQRMQHQKIAEKMNFINNLEHVYGWSTIVKYFK